MNIRKIAYNENNDTYDGDYRIYGYQVTWNAYWIYIQYCGIKTHSGNN